MTRMADPERPRDDQDFDDERFEDEGRRPIFSALWFRAILVVIVLGVIVAVAVRVVRRIRSLAQRPTHHGLVRAEHWLCVRAWMEPRGFEGASATSANSAYAARR